MTIKQTQTLPIMPTSATSPIKMYIARMKFGSGSSGPLALPVAVADRADWLKFSVWFSELKLLFKVVGNKTLAMMTLMFGLDNALMFQDRIESDRIINNATTSI